MKSGRLTGGNARNDDTLITGASAPEQLMFV
jgi:hypothetical protein